jgi:hypothetical protein
MPENYMFLTELLGLKVYDLKRRRIGRVRDAALVPWSIRFAWTGFWLAAVGLG